MADKTLVALNQALMRAYRLLGRETLRQYLALSLEALDVMDEQLNGPRGATIKDEVRRNIELLRRLSEIIGRRNALLKGA
jgi:hypothetical protein